MNEDLKENDCRGCRGRGRNLKTVFVSGIETPIKFKYKKCRACGGTGKQRIKK